MTNLACAALRRGAAGADPPLPARGERVEDLAEAETIGELTLKGFQRPVKAFNVVRLKE